MFGVQSGEKSRLIVTKTRVAVNVALVETFFISTEANPEEVSPGSPDGHYPPGLYAVSGSIVTRLTCGLALTDAEIELLSIGFYEGLSDAGCPWPLVVEEMLAGMRLALNGQSAEERLAERAAKKEG